MEKEKMTDMDALVWCERNDANVVFQKHNAPGALSGKAQTVTVRVGTLPVITEGSLVEAVTILARRQERLLHWRTKFGELTDEERRWILMFFCARCGSSNPECACEE